jgi:hypothetical protein
MRISPSQNLASNTNQTRCPYRHSRSRGGSIEEVWNILQYHKNKILINNQELWKRIKMTQEPSESILNAQIPGNFFFVFDGGAEV